MIDKHASSSTSDPLTSSVEDLALDALLDRLASPPTQRPAPAVGICVGEGDRYRLDRQLGQGGQGIVFLSRDLKLDRPVAIKFAQPHKADDDRAWDKHCEAFEHEIRLLAQLRHAHIVSIHDRGLWDGIPFLVMEFLQGQTLKELLTQRERLPPRRAVECAIQIAQALKAAHDIGIIHRDLKPDNIFVLADKERIRILDFGMAWFNPTPLHQLDNEVPLDEDASRRHGGTARYMAPEQWQRAGDQDERADIWALGVILFEMLMGHHPFLYDNLSLKTAILTGRAHPININAPNQESEEALTKLLSRCLETDKEKRPTNIYLVLRDLNHIQQTLEHGIDFDPPPEPQQPTSKKRTILIVLGIIVAVVLGVVLYGTEVHSDRAVFQNRVNIYAQKAGTETLKTCFGAQSRTAALCLFGPHSRTNRDGNSFHPITVVAFLNDGKLNPLTHPEDPDSSPTKRSSP